MQTGLILRAAKGAPRHGSQALPRHDVVPDFARGPRPTLPESQVVAPRFLLTCILGLWASLTVPVMIAQSTRPQHAISQERGELRYAVDEKGNRVPDFSTAGYRGGGVAIPNPPAVVFVPAAEGDQTDRIQAAIDLAATFNTDGNTPRVVLLGEGTFSVGGSLRLGTSNIVLRGSGQKTVLLVAGHDRRTLIDLRGLSDRNLESTVAITDNYIPVNSTRIGVADIASFKAGDSVIITRPSTAEWIKQLQMDDMGGDRHGFSWKPGSRDIAWDRTIIAIDGNSIVVDSPITLAIDSTLGGGTVSRYNWPGRISNVGVENLRMQSAFDLGNPKDESHAWTAIAIENARDAWVRQVSFYHFAGSAVCAWETVSRLTVEDCKYIDPISEHGGWRRNAFFTAGQQCLFQRCWAENAMHAFATGFCAAGPNVFLQCEAPDSLDDSGPIDSASCGTLFDNVKINGNNLNLKDRQGRAQGAGWSAFNCVLWNCEAGVVKNDAPPGAQNWAFGTRGEFEGRGHWQNSADLTSPLSLYVAQLSARLGRDVAGETGFMAYSTEASSSPTPEKAAELIAASRQRAPTLGEWIDAAATRSPIDVEKRTAKSIDSIWQPAIAKPAKPRRLAIAQGRLTIDGKPAAGHRREGQWWRGSIRPIGQFQTQPALTRFVPGRTGLGLTDDLSQVAADMLENGSLAFDHHYGLWYDRRRDDHQRVQRTTGDVAPPFFELPFARSGQGTAWDGLSKYDLTRYNPWYFDRLKQFAGIADARGLVLINQHYFQHNILEAGAHYADFPWRTANNINETGFPEPPPYAGDKRIFMAEQFYDINNPHRRELHRAYIRKCLDNLSGNSNVIHMTSEEFTGPVAFVEFWLDTIAEWQRETGNDVLVGLSATKDVQDAILADPERAKLVDLIDIRYWWYQDDGELYSPPGGGNLAPRQWARVLKPKNPSREQAIRAIKEYRKLYPDKAVTWSVDGVGGLDWTATFAN